MEKNNIWKIGTNIKSYIKRFLKIALDINSRIQFIETTRKNYSIKHDEKQYDNFTSKSTVIQYIRVLITLGIIEPLLIEEEPYKSDKLSEIEYRVKADLENIGKIIIAKFKYFLENKGNIKYIYRDEELTIKSIAISNELFLNKKIYSIPSNKRKNFLYWDIEYIIKKEEKEEFLKIINRYLLSTKNSLPKLTFEKHDGQQTKILFEIERDHKYYKDNDLNTKLIDLFELLASKYKIIIPIMQRNYVWNRRLVVSLLNDIDKTTKSNSIHFLGNLTIKKLIHKPNYFKLLDGQQRLTTMFLIFHALYIIYKTNHKLSIPKELLKIIVTDKNNEESILYKKFEHIKGSDDYDNFYDILANKYDDNDLKNPKNTFHENLNIIMSFVNQKIENISFPDKQKYLDKFTVSVFKKIIFNNNINQIENEFTIFEKLNNYSIKLNKIDLIKNSFLSWIEDEVLNKEQKIIQREFNDLIISKFKGKEKINNPLVKNFISYFLTLANLSKNDFRAQKNDYIENNTDEFSLFKQAIKKRYGIDVKQNKLSYNAFKSKIKDFSQDIENFINLTNISKYQHKTSPVFEFSDILFSFNKRYVYTPILSILINQGLKIPKNQKRDDIYTINHIRKLLFEIERYEVLFQITLYRGQSLRKKMEQISIEILKLIKEKGFINLEPINIRKIFIEMPKEPLPNIEKFKETIQNNPVPTKLISTLFNRMEFWIEHKSSIEIQNNPEILIYFLNCTREHIIPQDINKWSNDLKEWTKREWNEIIYEHKKYVDYIGNALVVDKRVNSVVSNSKWEKKIIEYNESINLSKKFSFIGIDSKKMELDSINHYKAKFDFMSIINRNKQLAKIFSIIYQYRTID